MIIKTIIHHTGFWTFFWRMLTPKASDTGALVSFLGVDSLTTPKFLVPKFVASEYVPKKHDHKMEAVPKVVHPGRLTWNLQITHLERKMIFQTSMIMVHVNLPGCTYIGKLRQPIPQHEAKSYAIPSMHGIFTYIYHNNQPNVGKSTSPKDCMGMIST